MCRISVVCVCLWAAASLARADRPGEIQSGSGSFGGITVTYSTTIEPALTKSEILLLGGGLRTGKNGIYRYMVDKASGAYFGYELTVAPEGSNKFRVTILPLKNGEDDVKPIGGNLAVHPVMLPSYPDPQVVEEGDTIALDLLVSPSGRQKVVDYIQVSASAIPKMAASSEPARDYTPDDGAIKYAVMPRTPISVNGAQVQEGLAFTGKNGSTFWLYFPGRGRFVLSLAPREGYNLQKAGTVSGNTVAFDWEGQHYEMRLSAPVIASGAVFNLYVLHDALYLPSRIPNEIQGGVDRLENLVGK